MLTRPGLILPTCHCRLSLICIHNIRLTHLTRQPIAIKQYDKKQAALTKFVGKQYDRLLLSGENEQTCTCHMLLV